jgi:signal transduction histidine kinase/DNA-binding response OmpR family regulator
MGLFYSWRANAVAKQQLASITVSTKQKSQAFELAQKILYLQNISTTRDLSKEEINEVKAILFRWQAAQKALVNGDEAYGIARADSKEIVSAVQNTSAPFIKAGEAIAQLSVKKNNWTNEEVAVVYSSIQEYSSKINDVIVLVNKETDAINLSLMVQLIFLILISLVTVIAGSFVFLRPILNRGMEAEGVKETASEELELVRKEKSEFLTQLSNEIKTPLSGVIGMSDLLLKTKLDEEQFRYAKSIRSGSSRLMDLINDIIDHTLMEAGELEIEKDSFEFVDSMEQVMDLMRPLAMEKGIEMILDIDQRIPTRLIQDERRLRQVLINIIGNAVKYTDRGEVLIKVELLNEEGGFVQLKTTISDTGIGMDIHAQRRVFASFAHANSEGEKSGAGLGLFISKKLIDKMGGRIWLESTPNRGTKVFFTLVAESEGLLPMSKVSALNGKKVLVVDDNKTSLKILVKQLSSYGMQAIPFNSPDLVEDMIGNLTRFDLALIDLEMPKVNGVSLAERIRDKYPNAVLPMIVMSQSGTKVFENKSTLFDAYITKPVKQSKLLETVVSVMDIKVHSGDSIGKHEGSFGRKHLNILIAHDNELTRAVAVKNLSLLGHRCSEAHTGDQIIELAGKTSYDMVLVDTEVESLRGMDAVRKLRQITSEDRMPLIVGLVENVDSKRKNEVKGLDTILNRKLETEDVQKTIDEWFISPHE